MNELISVIINAYNAEKYIKTCLESVLKQTYTNLEILIINDGSTDETLTICESYNDKRIRIISTDNMGLSVSRNIGLDNAKGEYFYFVDADDYIEDDTIEVMYNLAIKYDSKIVTSKSVSIYNKSLKSKPFCSNKVHVIDKMQALEKNLFSQDYFIALWNKLFKREVFDNLRFEDRVINDLALTYKIYMNIDNLIYLDSVKYYYVRYSSSICIKKKNDIRRNMDIFNVSIDRYNNIEKVFPDFYQNDIGLIRNIMILYNRKGKESRQFLKKQKFKKIFNSHFSIKIFFFNLPFKEKMMLTFFYINPHFCSFLFNTYRTLFKRKYN